MTGSSCSGISLAQIWRPLSAQFCVKQLQLSHGSVALLLWCVGLTACFHIHGFSEGLHGLA